MNYEMMSDVELHKQMRSGDSDIEDATAELTPDDPGYWFELESQYNALSDDELYQLVIEDNDEAKLVYALRAYWDQDLDKCYWALKQVKDEMFSGNMEFAIKRWNLLSIFVSEEDSLEKVKKYGSEVMKKYARRRILLQELDFEFDSFYTWYSPKKKQLVSPEDLSILEKEAFDGDIELGYTLMSLFLQRGEAERSLVYLRHILANGADYDAGIKARCLYLLWELKETDHLGDPVSIETVKEALRNGQDEGCMDRLEWLAELESREAEKSK